MSDTTSAHSPLQLSIVARLLLAFLLVSLVPIGTLAYLSFHETRAVVSEAHEGEEAGEAGHVEAGETLAGVPIATIELIVAGFSLILSVAMALYIGRTLVRPLRALAGAMRNVEEGNLDVQAPVLAHDEIGHLAEAFNQMVTGLKREVLIRDLFGQYVTPEVARVAIERRGQLDGQLVDCSVLFADIRGFTPLTEALPPAQLITLLNRYFSRMSYVVVEEGGMVNRFGGDSLLAVFGTPLNPNPDHAVRAVRAALRMRSALRDFNAEQAAAGLPQVRIGIGVATGEAVAGNVGSAKKVEYTVLGDTVNIAARLQELTKEHAQDILISQDTAKLVGSLARLTPICQVTVRGKSAPLDIYGVNAPAAEPAPA